MFYADTQGNPYGFAYFVCCEYCEYVLHSSHMAATAERPITLPQTERKQVQDLEAFLGRGNAVLLSSTGERIDLPNTVFEIL